MARLFTAAAAVAVAAALAAASAGAASAAPSSNKLNGSRPAWATASHKVADSDLSASTTFRVYLDNRDPAGAAAYATGVSTRGNAQFGKFLTPEQYRDRFSPTQASADAVGAWLAGQGFAVDPSPANRKYVQATGTLAQAAAAFGTTFATYSVDGRSVRSNTTELSVPTSLAGVQAVVGLDESQTLATHHTVVSAPAGFRNAAPCSAYWGEKTVTNTSTPDGTSLPASPAAYAPCGYAGAQLQGVYGVAGLIAGGTDGRGVTVAVIDAFASPTIASDVDAYSVRHGLPTLAKGQFTQIVAPGTYNRATNKKMDPEGWAGEETLDIEAVHTMAPGANIVYVGAPNNFRDLDAVMNRVVDGHVADIVTNSYGYAGEALPNGYLKPALDTQIQAAAEGISLFFSSGDSADHTGAVAGATPTPDFPASSPWVTAVGGTSLGIAQDRSRVFELGWETGRSTLAGAAWTDPAYQYGSGGGTSRLFAQPAYQAGVVPNAIAKTYGGPAMRAVPDVSALGDPTTGMAVGQTQTFSDGTYYDEYRIGGTSLSSPLYAGLFALVVQKAGHPYGLANPALYAARAAAYDVTKADRAAYPGAVRVDFVNGENAAGGYRYTARWFDVDEGLSIHVRPGYDDVTGVGSPNGTAWFDAVVGYGR